MGHGPGGGEAQVGPGRSLKVEVVTRSLANYMDLASQVVGELQRVRIDASLKQVESAQFYDWRTDRFARWPHVKGLVTHSVTYNCCRQADTWLDR